MRYRGIRLKRVWFTVLFVGILFCLLQTDAAYGAQKEIHFGSESYNAKAGETFQVGVYINSEDAIGAYCLTVEYDAAVLRYVSGADVDAGGSLTVSGETGERKMRRMLEFSLLSDDSSYLRLSLEDGSEETAVWAPVFAAGEDDSLRLLSLQTKPDKIAAFDAGQRVYALSLETLGELESVEAQAGDGVEVTLPDTAALHAGKNILTVLLRDASGKEGRYYLLVDVARQEAELPVFSWEGTQWQVLDGKTSAAAYLAMPYETATYSLGGVGMDFICDAGREVFLAFAQSPEGEVGLFAYSLSDGSFYRCGLLTTEQKNYYTIPLGALVALPSDYSVSLLTSQGVFAGMDEEGTIGLYLVNSDGELEEYVLKNQEVSAEDKTETTETAKKSGGWLVLAVCLAVAAVGMSAAYRRFSDVRLLMGAAASGFVMILAIGIWFLPRGNAEAEPVGSGGVTVTGSGQVSLQPQTSEETEEPESEENEDVIWGEVVGGESEPETVTPGQGAAPGAGTAGSENGREPGNNGGTQGNGGGNGGSAAPPAGGDVYTPPAWDGGGGNVYTPPAGGSVDTPPVTDGGGGEEPPLNDDGEAPPADGGNNETPPADGGNSEAPPADGGNSEAPPAGGGESVSGTEG